MFSHCGDTSTILGSKPEHGHWNVRFLNGHVTLARALDVGEFAILANLDLSSAFDVVNVNLLLKRMRII